MYGTIARFRPKKGHERELLKLMEEWDKERRPKVKGAIADYVYKPEKKPDELIMTVVFKDKESYMANAEDPEQDKWFKRFREHLESDPVWEDGEIIWGEKAA